MSSSENTYSRFSLRGQLTWKSLVAIIITAVSLITLYWFDQLAEHRINAEHQNQKITLFLTQHYEPLLVSHINEISAMPVKNLPKHTSVAALDAIIAPLLILPVVNIKLYARSGLTVYSSIHDDIGITKSDHTALRSALNGNMHHTLALRARFIAPRGELLDRYVVQTYRPLWQDQEVVGVFEVSSDITPTVARIKVRLLLIGLVVVGAFGALYLALFFTARRLDHSLLTWQNERRSQDTESRIAATAFQTQQPLMITDADAVILRVNQAFTDSTGYTEEEAIGRTPDLLSSGRHDRQFYRGMWDQLLKTGSWQGEIWDRRKNGETYPKWLSISAVNDDTGSVTHYVGLHLDMTERKGAEDQIHLLAYYDQLTGLANRTLLHDRLTQAVSAGAHDGHFGAVVFIDLDNFKTLNDTQGHDCGDQLLRQVAHRLSGCIRKDDTVARFGGDEFVVMIGNLGSSIDAAAQKAKLLCEKILNTLNQAYTLNNSPYSITASIGVTLFQGNSISNAVLLQQADQAMYESKNRGRNRLHFFNPAMGAALQERADFEADLTHAIESQQFVLYYQVQVGNGRVVGAEALLRWHQPVRGIVSPMDFIPLAESTGLILPLGNWVIETACHQLSCWARQPGMDHLVLAVNVSAQQLQQEDFVERVRAAIAANGVNPERLKLELTESMVVSDVKETIDKMMALKADGVTFALDDFGTGYSSLSYLKQLPLSQLKIDRSFITDILEDNNAAVIACSIIALGRSLGLEVIAEGVENDAQRDFLLHNGCSLCQGFYFGRPAPLELFEIHIQRSILAS